MKTNKSYTKRLRVTKKGKIVARKTGQNHYNAKESAKKSTNKKRTQTLKFTNKMKTRFLHNA